MTTKDAYRGLQIVNYEVAQEMDRIAVARKVKDTSGIDYEPLDDQKVLRWLLMISTYLLLQTDEKQLT